MRTKRNAQEVAFLSISIDHFSASTGATLLTQCQCPPLLDSRSRCSLSLLGLAVKLKEGLYGFSVVLRVTFSVVLARLGAGSLPVEAKDHALICLFLILSLAVDLDNHLQGTIPDLLPSCGKHATREAYSLVCREPASRSRRVCL